MYKNVIIPILLGVMVSFYFFPISFTFLPASINTKMMLAVFGAIAFVYDGIKKRSGAFVLSYEVFWSMCLAILFSASCYMSVAINGTDDMTYVSYILSFFTWLGGAYGICAMMRARYGRLSLHRITKYLMWVSVAQCVAALLNDNIPAFKAVVDSFVSQSQFFLNEVNRMYGIGASLDPAGVRFSIVLILIANTLCGRVFRCDSPLVVACYIFAFFFIVLVGNMISRTTTVGALLALGYIFLYLGKLEGGSIRTSSLRAIFVIFSVLAVSVPIVVYLYNTSPEMHSNLRFAFEGFFNWVETGTWSTSSTDKLNAVMWVWPKDLKTWIVGSGLIAHYVYSTDIGYCRFILYCGIIGFSIFAIFFVYNAHALNKKFESLSVLSFLLLALTFIIWIKVSTDIFQIYALLFCLDVSFDPEYAEQEESIEEDVGIVLENESVLGRLDKWSEEYDENNPSQ